jgi:hypothetical protein
VTNEAVRAERAGAIAAYESVNMPNMIRFENYDRCRRTRVETPPQLSRAGEWRDRVEDQYLAPRLDARRRHDWLPALIRFPIRMFDTPYPEAWSNIPEL